MKKVLLALLVVSMALTGAVSAFQMDSIVNITGSSTAGKFYIPVMKDVDVIVGLAATVAGTKDKESDLSGQLGVSTLIPYLGKTDIYVTMSKYSEATAYEGQVAAASGNDGTRQGTSLHVNSLVIGKNWLYRLTDRVSLGVSIPLVEVMLDGSKVVKVASGIVPVVGARIELF